jgi:hypothetical protein
MDILIWGGAGLTMIGFTGIIYSIFAVMSARRAATDDADLKLRMGRIIPINIGALFMSMLGLMVVVVGVILK